MCRLISVLMLFLNCISLGTTALAEKRVALVVANGDYKGAPLGNPTIDADIVASSLIEIGFTVKVVKNTKLDDFDAAVTTFADAAKGADVALFYFAGHGFTVNEGIRPISVLMSTSADVAGSSERVLRSAGIPLDDIVSSLIGQAKVTLVFVDACRNDPHIVRAIGGRGRGFAVLDPVQGGSVFIGLSTRLGSTANDGAPGMGSPFARAFAANIKKKGVRVDDAFRQLRDMVGAETSGGQLPDIVQDDLPNGAIVLVGSPGDTPPSEAAPVRPAPSPSEQAIIANLDRDAPTPSALYGSWEFGRAIARPGVYTGKLCQIILTSQLGPFGNRIVSCSINEAFWIIEGKELIFKDRHGIVSTIFTRLTDNHWEGPFTNALGLGIRGDARVIHYLSR